MAMRVRVVGVVLAAVLAASGRGARAEQAPPEEPARHVLDEYNVDVFGLGDAMRLSVGATYGDVRGSGFYWNKGFRLSWLQYQGDGLPKTGGYGVGGTLGFGWDPTRVVSPLATLSVAFPIDIHDRVNLDMAVSGGARIRLSTSESEQFAITFSLTRHALLGGDQVSDRTKTGLAVFFSSALFAGR